MKIEHHFGNTWSATKGSSSSVAAQFLCETKVRQFDIAAFVQEHIFGFHIAMNNLKDLIKKSFCRATSAKGSIPELSGSQFGPICASLRIKVDSKFPSNCSPFRQRDRAATHFATHIEKMSTEIDVVG